MVDPWWHEVVSNLSHENWPLSSTTAILPKKWWTKPVPMSGFRDCVHNLYLQDLEIQGFDLIAQCVTIIGHAHTNKPQPALNKIQVRTSDECRYIKIKKITGRIRSSLSLRKNCVLEAFRSTSGWSLQVVVTDSVKLRAQFETQVWMLHPRGFSLWDVRAAGKWGRRKQTAELPREAQKVQVE